ncbi:MAG TPA: hypothetical protein VK960_06450 [Acidimicrobiia bacterium]|nr:hypothetical protein [Acidimicrobiia bacterium]
MLPFVTPTTDTRREDQRAPEHTGQVRESAGVRGLVQALLLVAVVVSAIVLAVVLASGGSDSEPLGPTPTIQEQQ